MERMLYSLRRLYLRSSGRTANPVLSSYFMSGEYDPGRFIARALKGGPVLILSDRAEADQASKSATICKTPKLAA